MQITLGMMPFDPAIWSDGKPSTIGLVNGHETETLDVDRHQILWKNGAYIYVIGEMPLNLTNDYEFSPEQLLELARGVR